MLHKSHRSRSGLVGPACLLVAPLAFVFSSPLAQPALAASKASISVDGGEPNARFGASLDRAGNTMVVGAWGANGGEGLAYVSTLAASGWSAPVGLSAPAEGGDNFGFSVATNGSAIVVGAPFASEPEELPEPLIETGAITIFEQSDQGWAPKQRLYSSGRDEGSAFGYSVAMQGDVTLVGEPGADDPVRGRFETGAAYIYTRNGAGTWSEAQRLIASDAAVEDYLGVRVALSQTGSRTHAFVSAVGRDDKGQESGAVYVFERSSEGARFVFRKKLVAADGQAEDQFGYSLSAIGDRLIVGSPGSDLADAPDAGAVYVFERGSGAWTQQAKVVSGGGKAQDRFGYQLGLHGSGFAASNFPNLSIPGTSRAVSVYEAISSSEYQLQGVFNAPKVPGRESFGGAISYEPEMLLVGMEAAVDSGGAASGSVEVYDPTALSAPLGGMLGLGGLGLGLLMLRRRRA